MGCRTTQTLRIAFTLGYCLAIVMLGFIVMFHVGSFFQDMADKMSISNMPRGLR